MKSILLTLLAFISFFLASAQTQFHYRYGSPRVDRPRKAIQTQDGNFLVIGKTEGYGSVENGFLMKVNREGKVLWVRDYSGINGDEVWDIVELSDGSLAMCGFTGSYGAGYSDGFVMKTDSAGNALWSKAYGGLWLEQFYTIAKDGQGGFYVAGYAQDSTTEQGTSVIRMDGSGNILWSKWTPGWDTQGDWWPIDLSPLAAGGVVACGSGKAWKFSETGATIWSKSIPAGGTGMAILEDANGNVLINMAMTTLTQSGDNCIITLNSTGDILTTTCYGGTYIDWSRSFANTADGGIVLCGHGNSAGNGDYDISLIKLSATGTVQWARSYGTAFPENSSSAVQTSDGGYIITGRTNSYSHADSTKIILVKTDSVGNSTCNAISWNPGISSKTYSSLPAPDPVDFPFQSLAFTWTVTNRSFYRMPICPVLATPSLYSVETNLVLYPNPADNTLSISGEQINGSFRVFDSLGRQKLDGTVEGNSIQISSLQQGVYSVIIESEGKIINKRFVKQ